MPHIANVIRNTSNILRQRLEQRLLLRYIPESHVRKMSKRHYDVEYKQVNWLESRDDYRNYVLERIEENQNRYGNVLDIGCGDGKALASLSFKCRIGLDFSEKLLKKALKRDPNINVVLGDAEHLPFVNRTFDLVILLDVVEHVADSQVVSEEARRVARSEIILTTDYEGILTPSLRNQFVDRAPKLALLRKWGELTFFREGKPTPLWKGLLFSHGLMIRIRSKMESVKRSEISNDRPIPNSWRIRALARALAESLMWRRS